MFTQPLVIGSTYRLKFKSEFERHGVCTTPGVTCLHPGGGVFRLEQITNFRDLVLAGIKLYDVFFKPLDIPEEKYLKYFDGKPDDELTPEFTTKQVSTETQGQVSKTDVDGNLVVVDRRVVVTTDVRVETKRSLLKRHYRDNVDFGSYPIYKFVDAADSNDILWVPELTIAEFPEIDIREYKDISMVVHLGYVHDPTILDPMLLSVRERMAAYGWRPSLVKLYITDSKWMAPSEYEAIKSLRVPATIETITDTTRTEMIGRTAIVNGQLKKIVEPTDVDEKHKWLSGVENAEEEVCIDALIKQPAVLDNRLFLVRCKDGETYVTGDNYFVEVTKKSKMMLLADATNFREDGEFKDDETYYVFNERSRKYDVTTRTSRYDLVDYSTRDVDAIYYVKDADVFRVAGQFDFNSDGTFKTGVSYYTRSDVHREGYTELKFYVNKELDVVCRKKLTEGVDYNPGEPCVQYREARAQDVGLQHYIKVPGTYDEVAYGHHDDYNPDVLVVRLYVKDYTITTDTTRDLTKTYYIRESETVYRVATEEDFKPTGEFDPAKAYFELQEDIEQYRAATEAEIANPVQVLYVKQPDTYAITARTDPDGTYVRAFDLSEEEAYSTVLKESYSTLESLSLMGYKFDYSDVFGNSKTLTLQLEDIIETVNQTANVVLPDSEFDYDTFWSRFDNRIFRYTNYPYPNDPTVTETIDIVISRETYSLLSQKAGMLLGQSGQISKETYVKDDDIQKRNYYMKYVIQTRDLDAARHRIAALEEAVIQGDVKHAQYAAEQERRIAIKDERIRELEEQLSLNNQQ